MQHVRRLFGFALLPALSMLASLVLLPFIASRFGSGGWVALSIGQSVGALLSVAIGMAWPASVGTRGPGLEPGRPARALPYQPLRPLARLHRPMCGQYAAHLLVGRRLSVVDHPVHAGHLGISRALVNPGIW